MNKIEVCFTPQSFPLFKNDNAIVVVIDVLRATSAICAAFHHGVEKMIPVATTEEAKKYQKMGFIAAAERNGEMIEGFDLGNSPFGYMDVKFKGKTIAISTTNGTQAIDAARDSYKVIIGSFVNIEAIINYLIKQKRDVIFLCAGWKNKFNLEDTLFAGACAQQLLDNKTFKTECDSTLSATRLYTLAKTDLYGFLSDSSHRKRLEKLDLEKDIRFCLTLNQTNVIPVLEGKYLVKMV
ncbi:MAG: 2-phosphosulfolactate phosphatase [Bacteroidota bacterium]